MQIRKAHFIGIGGVGMSAVAKLLKDAGADVTGSDESVYSPVLDMLTEYRIAWKTPYAAANIPPDADVIVIGKNAKLVSDTNEEVAAAFASGKPVRSFPEILADLAQDKEEIVVAGSYGKSTCTALIAHCLSVAGLDPSYFIGAQPFTPNVSAALGTGIHFVLEGDEYPSSNTDDRSKFLHYAPSRLLITPLAHDHFNVFPTPEDYLKPFYELAAKSAHEPAVCVDGKLSAAFLESLKRPVTTYGLTHGTWRADHIQWGDTTYCSVLQNTAIVAQIETTLLGAHNIENIVGVGALLVGGGILTPAQFAEGVKTFKGVRRRMDRLSTATSIPVYEGFGSSYEKLQSAIAAMKQHYPERQLVVVFEPNTIAWRRKDALAQYEDAFSGAERVIIYTPPHDGKETELKAEEIASVVQKSIPASAADTPEEIVLLLDTELTANDSVLLSSSGAMGGLSASIPALAEKKFPL